ncbi:MAG: AtpZ/AtpI family protein [Actinobacteria bacterium]|nr:AtpZ/AtpI family protein [Actinomycetota bacterium]
MDPRERRETYNGASDAWAQAVELTVTPLIFGFLGHRLDLWVGTSPVFTLVLGVFCLAYVVWKACTTYAARMQVYEARLVGPRRSGARP